MCPFIQTPAVKSPLAARQPCRLPPAQLRRTVAVSVFARKPIRLSQIATPVLRSPLTVGSCLRPKLFSVTRINCRSIQQLRSSTSSRTTLRAACHGGSYCLVTNHSCKVRAKKPDSGHFFPAATQPVDLPRRNPMNPHSRHHSDNRPSPQERPARRDHAPNSPRPPPANAWQHFSRSLSRSGQHVRSRVTRSGEFHTPVRLPCSASVFDHHASRAGWHPRGSPVR
jgi:hypothetical protein